MKAKGKSMATKASKTTTSTIVPKQVENAFGANVSLASVSRSRSLKKASKQAFRGDRFSNIEAGISPFEDDNGLVSVTDAVELCQKAYWNVPIFKQTIDIMAEFSNSDIRWEGGNKTSREFFKAFFAKIGGWSLVDQFFREYYRSGNVYLWRFDGLLDREDAKKITQNYTSLAGKKLHIPIRYVFLNPADVRAASNINFLSGVEYFKVLNQYEVARLKHPQTQQEKELYESLTPEQKKAIQNNESPLIALSPERLHTVFYKKMDYEPMAIPMGYCVLDDIDMKLELKKMDRVILRTVESTILLITMGDEPEKGGVNEEAMVAMQEIFANETVGRVLVADYTTKVSFVIPELNKVLGPEKYQIINEDIANGLNNIFWGEQKFANAMIKIKVFVERLKDGQTAFLEHFLKKEVQRISKIMGFKDYPTPVFKEIDLQDQIQVARMITRLGELGILTADETIDAIKTGFLPSSDERVEHQKQFRDDRQEGLYVPITGPMPMSLKQKQEFEEYKSNNNQPNQSSPSQEAGRPEGTSSPQSTKNVSPIGTGSFSLTKLKDVTVAADKLISQVHKELKKRFKLKALNEQQREAAMGVVCNILATEPKENWGKNLEDYLEFKKDINHEMSAAIEDIEAKHQVSRFVASLLYHSSINGE